MLRKFYINMKQKGDILLRCFVLIDKGILEFSKTDKRQVQILSIDWGKLEKLDTEELSDALDEGFYLYKRRYTLENILGIGKGNPYKGINMCKELRENDIKGYIQVDSKFISKCSDKAYYLFDRWVAKSQTILKEDRLYIKDWLFFREFY